MQKLLNYVKQPVITFVLILLVSVVLMPSFLAGVATAFIVFYGVKLMHWLVEHGMLMALAMLQALEDRSYVALGLYGLLAACFGVAAFLVFACGASFVVLML